MHKKILFVDDERAVLGGYSRLLHGDFDVHIALSGSEGLKAVEEIGPFAVIVSDMRMPGMTGAEFLATVCRKAPLSSRMLLTGYSDVAAAASAVNEGNIFHYLTKPCSKDDLCKAISTGISKYELLLTEKEVLENTLKRSLSVLSEVLGTVSPAAFGRSMRIFSSVKYLWMEQRLPDSWQLEAAALLSQLGCVALDPTLIGAAFVGSRLTIEDENRFKAHPQVASKLLIGIPRMEAVAWMIRQQFGLDPSDPPPHVPVEQLEELNIGAAILRLAVAYDTLKLRGFAAGEILARLHAREAEFPKRLVHAIEGMGSDGSMEQRKLSVDKLAAGMVLDQALHDNNGSLIIPKGHLISPPLAMKLKSYADIGIIPREILVMVSSVATLIPTQYRS